MSKLPRLALVSAIALLLGCSSNPKPDEPSPPTDDPPSEPADPEPTAPADPPSDTAAAPASTVKRTGEDDGSIPDDYTLMEGDCVQLGKKLGAVWRVELRKSMSPKLSDKQREEAEASIEQGASKKADDWAGGCVKSLVGKSVDPKTLKCAFDAKDLKTFEACLN